MTLRDHTRGVPACTLLLLLPLCGIATACGGGSTDPLGLSSPTSPSSPTEPSSPIAPAPAPAAGPIGLRIISPTELIDPGETVQLQAMAMAADSTETIADALVWSSTNSKVVAVSSDGFVVGVDAGTANIVVRSGDLTASASVSVRLYLSKISVGNMHACGLTANGAAFCWGGNTHGELGTGNFAGHSVPVRAAAGYVLESIVAAGGFTCAVAAGGFAYCWGDNSMKELGLPLVGRVSPRPVAVTGGRTYTSISGSSMAHTCALEADGAAWCWGYNRFGMLGHGILRDETEPVAVAGGLSFTALHSSFFRTCGIDSVGSVYCWGRGGPVQLGDADVVLDDCGGESCALSPRPADSQVAFVSVSVSRMSTCALGEDARPYCWGSNESGQLGVGGFDEIDSPTPVTIPAAVASVTTGRVHACALMIDGLAYCWGDNSHGQLGNGTWVESDLPIAVVGQHVFTHLSAGFDQTCGLTSAGAAYCWGNNAAGQLGNGTFESRNIPTRVQAE